MSHATRNQYHKENLNISKGGNSYQEAYCLSPISWGYWAILNDFAPLWSIFLSRVLEENVEVLS